MEYTSHGKKKSNVLLSLCFWAVAIWCVIAVVYLFRYGQEMEQRFVVSPRAKAAPSQSALVATAPKSHL